MPISEQFERSQDHLHFEKIRKKEDFLGKVGQMTKVDKNRHNLAFGTDRKFQFLLPNSYDILKLYLSLEKTSKMVEKSETIHVVLFFVWLLVHSEISKKCRFVVVQWRNFYYGTFYGPLLHFLSTFYFICTIKCAQKVE